MTSPEPYPAFWKFPCVSVRHRLESNRRWPSKASFPDLFPVEQRFHPITKKTPYQKNIQLSNGLTSKRAVQRCRPHFINVLSPLPLVGRSYPVSLAFGLKAPKVHCSNKQITRRDRRKRSTPSTNDRLFLKWKFYAFDGLLGDWTQYGSALVFQVTLTRFSCWWIDYYTT